MTLIRGTALIRVPLPLLRLHWAETSQVISAPSSALVNRDTSVGGDGMDRLVFRASSTLCGDLPVIADKDAAALVSLCFGRWTREFNVRHSPVTTPVRWNVP